MKEKRNVPYDLERMKKALKGEPIHLPHGLTREEKRQHILNSARLIEK